HTDAQPQNAARSGRHQPAEQRHELLSPRERRRRPAVRPCGRRVCRVSCGGSFVCAAGLHSAWLRSSVSPRSYMTAQASAYWVQDNRDVITDSLQSCFPDLDVLWRTNTERLAQDGWTDHVSADYPEDAEAVAVKEGGISYLVH